MKEKKEIARIEFGSQLKAYRSAAGISQDDIAIAIGKNQSYMVAIEKGDNGVGIDYMEAVSAYFGVKYYVLANPNFPIPSKSELRNNIKNYCIANEIDPSFLDNEISPGYARNMDLYLASDKLAEPKTSYQIAKDYVEMFDETISPSKVTDILNRDPRKKLVDITKSGGKTNLYKLKISKKVK